MSNIYYQPEGMWFGDCMPFYLDGTYYLYHQRDTRRPGPFGEPFGWCLVTTEDFVAFEDYGEVISHGGDADQDQFIFAGSVVEGPEGFAAIYTGYNRDYAAHGRPAQVLMVARSSDLIQWTKSEEAVVVPQDGYDPEDWRDPFVVWDPDQSEYLMILGARKLSPKTETSGRTVCFTSKDLKSWEFQGDFWSPGLYTMHEMPDLFEMRSRWYLLTTEYSSECKTVYGIGESLTGPWRTPSDNAFDGRAYYAARSAGTADQRFLFGWVATKEGESDSAPWEWGGALLVHEVFARVDGTLGVAPPSSVRDAFGNSRPLISAKKELRSTDTLSGLQLGDVPFDSFRLVLRVRIVEVPRSLGVRFSENPDSGESYCFNILGTQCQLTFDRRPSFPWPRYDVRGLSRPLQIVAGETYTIELLVDGSIATLYVDGTALTARTYDRTGSGVAVDVFEGGIEVTSAELQCCSSGD